MIVNSGGLTEASAMRHGHCIRYIRRGMCSGFTFPEFEREERPQFLAWRLVRNETEDAPVRKRTATFAIVTLCYSNRFRET